MPTKYDPIGWMLSEAVESLSRAERLHRQFFQLRPYSSAGKPTWEPPIDVLETEEELLITIALPGVAPDHVEVVIEDSVLRVAGHRVLPPELRNAAIHRLELPQGRFERRIALPAGRYSVRRLAENGCLVLRLCKMR